MQKRKGFNITELIVVVTIIAGLIAILVPVIGSAREISYKVFCKNNLRQLGICVQSYAMENKVYPVCVGDSNLTWQEFLDEPEKAKNQMLGVPISLWNYHQQKEVYDCPMLFRQKAQVSYCYNSRAGRELQEGELAYAFKSNTGIASNKVKVSNYPPPSTVKKDYYYLTPDRVKKPETFVILYDLPFLQQPVYTAPELFSSIDPNDSPNDAKGYLWNYKNVPQKGPHRTGFNILFADLQVEWYRSWDDKKMKTQAD